MTKEDKINENNEKKNRVSSYKLRSHGKNQDCQSSQTDTSSKKTKRHKRKRSIHTQTNEEDFIEKKHDIKQSIVKIENNKDVKFGKDAINIIDLMEHFAENELEAINSEEEKEIEYLESLPKMKRKKLEKYEMQIRKLNIPDKPLKYKILESEMTDHLKAQILQKLDFYQSLEPSSSEYQKLQKYMNGLIKIPFGKYRNIQNVKTNQQKGDFILNLAEKLNNSIYGQFQAKDKLLEIIGTWLKTGSTGFGNVIGLYGPAGVGKTSLIKNGLAKALNLPFYFLPLGGTSGGGYLEGHDFTYEGSTWGRIVDILIECKCMNPILFFDELDKISETKFGEEITGILTHLTDPTQNNSFHDKYFSGIDFDLSKCLIIFSYNYPEKINPILKDRIVSVECSGFCLEEKVKIFREFIFPEFCYSFKFNQEDIIVSDETLIMQFIQTECKEKGVRSLRQKFQTIFMKLNVLLLKSQTEDISNKFEILSKKGIMNYNCNIELPINLDYNNLKKLSNISQNKINPSLQMMYL